MSFEESMVPFFIEPQWGVEVKGFSLSFFFKRALLGLDVDEGILSERGTKDDRVLCLWQSLGASLVVLSLITRDVGADQAIRLVLAWRCPTERMEQVIVNDSAVELGVLKAGSL